MKMTKLLTKFYKIIGGADKVLHFLVCFFLTAIIGAMIAPIVGVIVAVGLSVLKEGLDSIEGGTGWSWKDIISDAVGIAVALVVI